MADPYIRRKYEWLEAAMHDGQLSPSARLVAYEIFRHLNTVTGDAWPSQQRMATLLGLGLRTVERAVAELEGGNQNANGLPKLYILSTVEGRSKTYMPCFNIIGTPANLAGHTRQNLHGTPAKKGGLSLLSNFSRELGGVADHSDTDVARPDGATEEGGLTIDHDPIAAAWGMVRHQVIEKHGERAKRFMDRLSARRRGHNIELGTHGSFYVDTINRDYLATLVDAWRAECSWVRDVRVIMSSAARATE